MTPVLISVVHGIGAIPLAAFKKLKEVCSKLYGDLYCLSPSEPEDTHFIIKVIRLISDE